MSLSHGILGFLSYGSMTGYDLSKAFSSSVKLFWHAQTSQVYLELTKLEKKELVTCEHILQTEKPNKKLYSITQKGKNEFLSWLSSDTDFAGQRSKDAFLMKIFFSGERSPKETIDVLNQYIEDNEKFIFTLKDTNKSVAHYGEYVEEYKTLYWQITADFGYSYTLMSIEWAKRAIKKLEELL